MAREEDGGGSGLTLFGGDAHNLRDNLTALLHEDLIPEVEVKGGDEVGIV